MPLRLGFAFVILALASTSHAWAGKEGPEFTIAKNDAASPAIVGLADGGFVSVWIVAGNRDIYGRRYSATGAPFGAPFRVTSPRSCCQSRPSVAALSNGGFVVTWAYYGGSPDRSGIYARRYDVAGMRVGKEFRVNVNPEIVRNAHAVSAVGDGFVVIWTACRTDGTQCGVFAQRYNVAGTRLGNEMRVNNIYKPREQGMPSVTGLRNGGFVVTWHSRAQDGHAFGIYAQRYNAEGVPIGNNFLVNTQTVATQREPSVAAVGDGFVVAWHSTKHDRSGIGIYAQRYSASGAPRGGEFRVNTMIEGHQILPSVASLSGGDFVIAWASNGGIYGQRYRANGIPFEGEFEINTSTAAANQWWFPSVSGLSSGGFVVTWGEDHFGTRIYGQRFAR